MSGSKATEPTTGRTDWAALRATDEAEIERSAIEDDINPATDGGHWAAAMIGLPSDKTSFHASFDRDVVEFFKRGGRGYQARMNAVLRRFMEDEQHKSPTD